MAIDTDSAPITYYIFVAVPITFLLILVAAAGPCWAQSTNSPHEISLFADVGPATATVSSANLVETTSPADPPAQATGTTPSTAGTPDDQWHVAMVPYLWFPAMHGTVGARGRDASVHESATDILSHFRFGLASGVEMRRKRLVLPLDFMWVRLEGDHSTPFPNLGATSATVKIAEVLLTPEIGYRLIDQEKFKADAVTGFRYWHIGQSLTFSPGELGLNPSASLNWVDPLVGGRIQMLPSPKVELDVLGDVGGWGTGSQLEYQVVGLLGYRIKPKWSLLVGYRYLDVDYRSGGSLFDITMPGIMFGASYTFK